MLKNVIGFAVLGMCLVGLENYRCVHLQSLRTAEQAQLLGQLESLNRPAVSQLIEAWRLTYPEPDEDRLDELRDLAAQLSADPDALEVRQPDDSSDQKTRQISRSL